MTWNGILEFESNDPIDARDWTARRLLENPFQWHRAAWTSTMEEAVSFAQHMELRGCETRISADVGVYPFVVSAAWTGAQFHAVTAMPATDRPRRGVLRSAGKAS